MFKKYGCKSTITENNVNLGFICRLGTDDFGVYYIMLKI